MCCVCPAPGTFGKRGPDPGSSCWQHSQPWGHRPTYKPPGAEGNPRWWGRESKQDPELRVSPREGPRKSSQKTDLNQDLKSKFTKWRKLEEVAGNGIQAEGRE